LISSGVMAGSVINLKCKIKSSKFAKTAKFSAHHRFMPPWR
jgi:hypothetical protein